MKLRIIPTSEGYFDVVTNQYIYNYTDHLGNVRLSYSDTNKDGIIQPRQYQSLICNISPAGNICYQGWKPGEIVEVNNYYPFGLMHNYTATTQNAYQYKYNGKELQESGMYDYGARFYMPDIGRWGVVDPLAEVTSDLSPYHYAGNNPIMYNDPTGMLSQSAIDQVWGSASGTTWYNTGGGFTSDGGESMDYDGNRINWGAGYTDMLMQSVGLSPMGQGGGGVAGEARLPLLWINSPSNISWAWQAQANQQAFVENFNSRSDFAWDRMLNAGRYNDGPVKMIGGMGDPAGLFDIGGQIISNWKPENQYLAVGAGILGAIALKKPGLVTKTRGNTTLYRNFGWNELSSIKNAGGKFSIHPNQFQGKQFWVGESGMNMWTNSSFAKPFTAKITVPKSFVTPGHKNYIFMESNMMIDGFPGGTVLPSNMKKFNSAIKIDWIRY